MIISYQICHLDHQTSYFKVTFIQIASNLHLLVSFYSLQPISWLLFLFLNVFSRLIPWQVFLPQLFLKPLLIFIFLMLLQVQLLLAVISFFLLQPILVPSVLVIPLKSIFKILLPALIFLILIFYAHFLLILVSLILINIFILLYYFLHFILTLLIIFVFIILQLMIVVK